MKYWNAESIAGLKSAIHTALDGVVTPRHTETQHFYEVDLVKELGARIKLFGSAEPTKIHPNPIYPSVTGKLQILKDESLINFKMNRAIEAMRNYVFKNFTTFTSENIMDHISTMASEAENAPASIVQDAGDVGTRIHDIRHEYFKEWMRVGGKPSKSILEFIPASDPDIRVISALRALDKFINENDYEPVACELLVYSHKLEVAGTLDDLGFVRKVMRVGDPACTHRGATLLDIQATTLIEDDKGFVRCANCGYKARRQFVLMDLKTSNQFKDHYFFQVALYYWMFFKLTGYKPERCFILKVSKTDGRYKIEDLYRPATLASFARSMVRTHKGVTSIKDLRSDNQRTVVKV